MSAMTVKVAISIPKELFRAIEQARKKNRKGRSAVVQDALRRWLKEQQEARDIQRYIEGYRRMPETRREIEEAEAMARDSWAEWEW